MKATLALLALALVATEAQRHSHGHGHRHHGCGWGSSSGGGWGSRPSSTTRAPSTSSTTAAPTKPEVPVETRSLDQIHEAAKAEGCKLIIYAGGDTPDQQDWAKTKFEERFPNCTIDFIVDYSKYHDARIDFQIQQNRLIPDVVQLQTLQNFPRWKGEGHLLNYKVNGWEQVYDSFKDPDGAYVGIYVNVFTNCINQELMPDPNSWPTDIMDYLKPELKGHITLTYPNDDDAVLHLFYKFAQKHGWDYLIRLKEEQNVTWVRGTQEPLDALGSDRTWVAPAADCGMSSNDRTRTGKLLFVLPTTDYAQAWPQTAAIMKASKNSEAAKLYLNWILDPETQKNEWYQWSSRKDVDPPGGYKSIFDYPGQIDPNEFMEFMSDRELVERTKFIVTNIVGEPQGPPSPGLPGLYPTKPLKSAN